MAMRVNVVCRNMDADRVIPRFSRYLADLGWTLTRKPVGGHDVTYLSAYFETQVCKGWPPKPGGPLGLVAAYFTHLEKMPKGNAKAQLFHAVAGQVQLRVATARMYAEMLEAYGPTVQILPPVERQALTPPANSEVRPSPKAGGGRRRVRAGFSGYTYGNGRKGEALAKGLVATKVGKKLQWKASGRGWPVPTRSYKWAEMPDFYRSLDILVCTASVEGVPMPPLEALSCGVSVVIPRGVGLLDELPDVMGITRYDRGDPVSLMGALVYAVAARGDVDPEALRAVTEPFSVEAWCEGHEEAIERLLEDRVDGGIGDRGQAGAPFTIHDSEEQRGSIKIPKKLGGPVEKGTESKRGIFCVAFGDPARTSALEMMESAKTHMPEIPIALCSDRKIGPEDVLIVEPDSDIGGRRAKLKAYRLAPAEWESVLYLDADTEVLADITFYFQLIEDGWEFVICKDPHLMDTMHGFRRKTNLVELRETEKKIHTLHTLQYNGGVWAFGRNKRIARFFARWLAEWETYAGRDQGALIRAMYTEPLKVYLLGNEWNTFPKYTRGIRTAGLMHYPGKARRWKGQIPGRIDSPVAWAAVKKFEARRKK